MSTTLTPDQEHLIETKLASSKYFLLILNAYMST